jgi:hypothetical protein
MTKYVNITKFAERVERLCDFLLNKVEDRSGSEDLKVIEDLKQDAADIQFNRSGVGTIEGIHDYMHGIPPSEEETKET